jgi:hypothetical protein
MPKRKKAGDPELLLVSFCDIVTVITAALFMTMVVTIQEAMRVPVLKGTPLANRGAMMRQQKVPGDFVQEGTEGGSGPLIIAKRPVYFECRKQMIFPINYTSLFSQMRIARSKSLGEKSSRDGSDPLAALAALQTLSVGDDYYVVRPDIMLPNKFKLEPRAESVSETEPELEYADKSKFFSSLKRINQSNEYIVFLVRDDSFNIFRRCRRIANEEGFESGWEYLDDVQPIEFGGIGGQMVLPQ